MRNFTATVKEREAGQPCFVMLEPKDSTGLPDGRTITLDLREGTGLGEALAVAKTLNEAVATVSLS